MTSTLKVEKVVKEPIIPVDIPVFTSILIDSFGRTLMTNQPSKNEPSRLTTSVPIGKLWIEGKDKKERKYLKILPIAPPTPTYKYTMIVTSKLKVVGSLTNETLLVF
jgi:hypothetical protein